MPRVLQRSPPTIPVTLHGCTRTSLALPPPFLCDCVCTLHLARPLPFFGTLPSPSLARPSVPPAEEALTSSQTCAVNVNSEPWQQEKVSQHGTDAFDEFPAAAKEAAAASSAPAPMPKQQDPYAARSALKHGERRASLDAAHGAGQDRGLRQLRDDGNALTPTNVSESPRPDRPQ